MIGTMRLCFHVITCIGGLKNCYKILICNAAFGVRFEKMANLINVCATTLNQRVPGSSPGAPTNKFNNLTKGVAKTRGIHKRSG